MAISTQTSRTLHDTLGAAAADDLSKWMSEVESGRSELRELSEMQIRRFSEQTELQMQRFREQSELQAQRFASLLDARFADAHRQWSTELHAMATELRTEMHTRFNDLLKWSFVFWVGAIGSLAALVGVLR